MARIKKNNASAAHGVDRLVAALDSRAAFAGSMLNQIIFYNAYASLI